MWSGQRLQKKKNEGSTLCWSLSFSLSLYHLWSNHIGEKTRIKTVAFCFVPFAFLVSFGQFHIFQTLYEHTARFSGDI